MEILGDLIQGIYDFMVDLQIPFFGQWISLYSIFMFGLIGGIGVWALKKFLS